MTTLTADTAFNATAKKDLMAPATFGIAPHAVMTRSDLSPAAKLVYFALIDHLGNVGTTVWPGEARLTRLTALSISSVRRGIRQLEHANLINTISRPGRTPGHQFNALDNQASPAPTPNTPPTPSVHPGQIDRTPGQIDRRTNPPNQEKKRSLPLTPSLTTAKVLDTASNLEQLLDLDALVRTDDQDQRDFTDLVRTAKAIEAGTLGDPQAAGETLSTLAHQIGRRQPPARNPLAMLLAEVGRMRIRACRTQPRTEKHRP